ncbi:MAG: hypothetical protein Q7U11_08180, partial [Phenylobacterium sp.]|nr:hypothetical protein [Phenylobacterium sp.]
LGIGVNGAGGGVEIIDPRLPIGIDVLAVDGLRVGEEKVDLLFERIGGKIVVQARGHSLVPVRIC